MFFNNTIYINEHDYNCLYTHLNEFINLLHDDISVDSIYFTNYNSGYGCGSIGITVLTNECEAKSKLQNKLNIFNAFFKKLNFLNTNIHFSVDYIYNYHSNPITPINKLRIEELIESEIIFDKSGYLSNLKNKMINYVHEYKFDIVKFKPQIDEEIAFSLYMKQKNDIK